MLELNQKAPFFSSLNQKSETVQSSDYENKNNVILYFYPKDDTPGCTIEANEFTGLASEFEALNTVVVGVSKDSCESHQAFIDKFGLQLPLLADTDGKICEDYNVWQEKEKNGIKKMGIVRSTFLIDKQGVIKYLEYGVAAEGHAKEMLEKVKAL